MVKSTERKKVGILCAGVREAAPVIAMLANARKTSKAMLTFWEGTIENVPVVTLYSGVCKVNAAIAAQLLIDCYDCGMIINTGTAGGISEEVHLFDTIVSTEAVYHDVAEGILTEFHPWMESVFFKAAPKLLSLAQQAAHHMPSGHRTHFGRMATGEAFVGEDRRQEILERFKPLCVDMETAAIAHVCYVNKVPFIAVRTITDAADHSGAEDFENNCARAAGISAEFVRKMLERMGSDEV